MRSRLFVTWNIHTIGVFCHFCFLFIAVLLIIVLFVLFLSSVFSLALFFLCYPRDILSRYQRNLKCFFSWHIYPVYIVSGCKALCIVMGFRVLWFICWSSSLVHFKNDTEYLTKRTAKLFIPLMRSLLYSLVSSSFFVLPRHSFFIFSFISACLMVSASNISKYLYVYFSLTVQIFPWFCSSLPPVICRFPLCIMWLEDFSIPNSIPISSIHIFTACIRISNSFHFSQSLMSSLYIRWLIYLSLYPPVHFLILWLPMNINECILFLMITFGFIVRSENILSSYHKRQLPSSCRWRVL